jgi:hypothetical protein
MLSTLHTPANPVPPATRWIKTEEMQTTRKLYQQMVMEKAQIKAEPTVQIASLEREEDMSIAE